MCGSLGRYRQQLIPANLTIPLVISEFGIDNSPCGGSPNLGGWHKYCAWWASKYGIGNTQDDCAAFYVDQISWFLLVLHATLLLRTE